MKLVHGGDTVGYRERYGHDALDFSANVSPLGVPEAVARAIGEAAFQADQYPDPLCRALTAALSRTEAVPKAWFSAETARRICFPAGSGGKAQACAGSRADVRRIRGGAGNGRLRDSSAYAA